MSPYLYIAYLDEKPAVTGHTLQAVLDRFNNPACRPDLLTVWRFDPSIGGAAWSLAIPLSEARPWGAMVWDEAGEIVPTVEPAFVLALLQFANRARAMQAAPSPAEAAGITALAPRISDEDSYASDRTMYAMQLALAAFSEVGNHYESMPEGRVTYVRGAESTLRIEMARLRKIRDGQPPTTESRENPFVPEMVLAMKAAACALRLSSPIPAGGMTAEAAAQIRHDKAFDHLLQAIRKFDPKWSTAAG